MDPIKPRGLFTIPRELALARNLNFLLGNQRYVRNFGPKMHSMEPSLALRRGGEGKHELLIDAPAKIVQIRTDRHRIRHPLPVELAACGIGELGEIILAPVDLKVAVACVTLRTEIDRADNNAGALRFIDRLLQVRIVGAGP